MKHTLSFPSPIGKLWLQEEDGALVRVSFQPDAASQTEEETPLLGQAKQQLAEYFAGQRMQGTPFQQKVWAALREIPYGETRSYGQIAAQVGNPKASRAVGMANNRNPIAIIVPCHRVIGANGSLTGYAGGLNVKEELLALERRTRQR